MVKLTLSLDPKAADRVKQLAKDRDISVSEAASELILKTDTSTRPDPIPPQVKEAIGMFTLPKGKTLRQFMKEAKAERAERYLR